MTDYPLEPDRRAMEEMGRRALALVADFVDGLPDAPASNVDDIEARLPEYLHPPGEGPGDLGELLTRDYRGLRMWLPLHLHGVSTFRQALDETLDLAAWAYRELSADQALVLPWEPELSIVAFRLQGDESTDRDNQRLLERIHATRRLYLSTRRIDGRQLLRLCVISHRTHQPDIEDAVGIIRSAVAKAVPAR